MRIAVISDIHANLDAFQAVLADMDARGVDDIICLGDTIGYGPDPEAAATLLHERGIASVIGNHELAMAHPRYRRWFNPVARESLLLSIDRMTDATRRTMGGLASSLTEHGCRFVHGFPPDSALIYLFEVSENRLRRVLNTMTESVCFVGHTHLLERVSWDGEMVTASEMEERTYRLEPDRKHIVNIGSVGQPRDGNNNAKYVLYDTDTGLLDVRFVPYDIAAVVARMRAAGLPEVHAKRLL